MLAYGPMGGHAYTEVYLGKAEGVDSDVDRMIRWLKARYNVPEIKTHNDLDTGDVWLNLDWWKDPNNGAELTKHPGGPFFKATNQTPIPIRDDVPKQPLKPLNDPPIAQFLVSPTGPDAEENITFDASPSRDIGVGGGIDSYMWNFGDGRAGEGKIVNHVYSQGDRYQVTLTVVDNDGARNSTMRTVEANALPVPIIDYYPKNPKTGDSVSFDGSKSWDKEDGKISKWEWEFGDGETSVKGQPPHYYYVSGNYITNLTVYDKRKASNKTSITLKINEPPAAKFSYSTGSMHKCPNEGEIITFDASESNDLDGNITSYKWNFGDRSSPGEGKLVTHSYAEGGNIIVSLEITDDCNATVTENRTLKVNWLPIARISPIALIHAPKEEIIFDASNSSDNESRLLRYSWDFNDDNIPDSGAKRDAYNYKLTGQYRGKLTVTDDNDASNSTYFNISIMESNAKPIDHLVQSDNASLQEAGTISNATLTTIEKKPLIANNWEDGYFYNMNVSDVMHCNDKAAKLCVLGRYTEALSESNISLEVFNPLRFNKSCEIVWFNRAIILSMLGKYDEAINASDEALQLDMTDAGAWSNRGCAFEMYGSNREAIRSYDKALFYDESLAQAWYGKARVLGSLGRFKEALVCFDKAISINGSSRELTAELLYEKARSTYYYGRRENNTIMINDSYRILESAAGMGYILDYPQNLDYSSNEDGGPFGSRPKELTWESLVPPRFWFDISVSWLPMVD
jgi:PKD repeat protein